jgi:hypothetical protein
MSKIKYVETSPEKKELIFEHVDEYYDFFKKRVGELTELQWKGLFDFKNFKHQTLKLKLDGTPKKVINPIWLQTREARAKALINAKNYRDTKKKQHENKASKNYSKAIEVLKQNNIDLKLLNISIKRR